MLEKQKSFILILYSVTFSLLIIYGICNLIFRFHPNYVDLSHINEIFAVELKDFHPEPRERMQFIISVIFFPVILILTVLFLKERLQRSFKNISILYNFSYLILIIIITGSLWIFFFNSNNDIYSANKLNLSEDYFFIIIGLIFLIFLWWINKKIGDKVNIFLEIIIISFILFIAVSNVYSLYSIDSTGQYTSHFNAVYHSVQAVLLNKSLLVDITNQYGLYPHFLEFIFRIIGLSVFKFTLLMSFFISITLYVFYKILNKLIENKFFVIIGLSLVLFYGYMQLKIITYDSYFQYFPIRTIFISFLLYISISYLEHKQRYKYIIANIIASLAVLWNLDTGIIAFISWILLIIYNECSERENVKLLIKKIATHIAYACFSFIAVLFLFSIAIYARSGIFPNFIEFINYQKYFYGFGFFMLPMPKVHSWNLVMLVYAIGLTKSCISIINKERNLKMNIIFLLSILGIGIFSYYQGRSHDHVLTVVWYPSLILVAIFVYELFIEFKKNITEKRYVYFQNLLFVVLLIFELISFIYLLKGSNYFYTTIKNNWNKIMLQQETEVTTGLNFIEENVEANDSVLILSNHSGIQYFAAKKETQLNIPGLSEIFLNKDYNKIISFIENQKPEKIFLDKSFLTAGQSNFESNIKVLNSLFKAYHIESASKFNNIMLYKKNNSFKEERPTIYLIPQSVKNIHFKMIDKLYVFDVNKSRIEGLKDEINPISLGSEFTLEILVKPDYLQVPYSAIIGNHPGFKNFQGFVIQQNPQEENMYSFGFGNGATWSTPLNFKLEPQKMNYLAITFVNGNVKIFVNGNKVIENNTNFSISNSDLPLTIGNWINRDREFNGLIDEIIISDRALSQNQILSQWKSLN